MAEKKVVGGIPVECLTGEPAAVWSGWRILGDREVVREASAKGTHISLAQKCLAFRRNVTVDEACSYFNTEVETWIKELLDKRQIYRASHILNNVGKDPKEYIFTICTTCTNAPLRDYLAEYMVNSSGFQDLHIDAWNILKSIAKYEDKYKMQYKLSSDMSIEDVLKLPENVRMALKVELYFLINESSLVKSLPSNVLWDYLLSNNRFDILQLWIDSYFGDNVKEEDIVEKDLISLLPNLEITPDMIDAIELPNFSALIKNFTQNQLCRYGIFTTKERADAKVVLSRVFNCTFTLKDFERILTLDTCNLDNKTEFLPLVEKDVCLARCFQEDKNMNLHQKHSNLYDVISAMCKNQDGYPDTVINAIFQSIQYLSDDVPKFLKENYILVFALMCLQHEKSKAKTCQDEQDVLNVETLKDILNKNSSIQIGNVTISHEIIKNMLEKIPLLHQIVHKKSNEETITMYDLLDGYENINIRKVFKWRFKNETMPHFSKENLVRKYGYKATLSYMYYLKEARPNMAIRQLKLDQDKILSTSSQLKSQVAHQAHTFALKNLHDGEIVCSCISFIEMLGVDSECLRLHVTAADYVQRNLNICIDSFLEPALIKNKKNSTRIMGYLEESFMKFLSNERLIEDTTSFIEILNTWDIFVRFARTHNVSLPDCLLKYLARRNYWLEFIIVAHVFAYPVNQILEVTKLFEDFNIREHLLSCLNNPQIFEYYENEQKKITPRDTRQCLYYKIGLKENIPFTSSSQSTSSGSSFDSRSHSFPESMSNDVAISIEDDVWLTILKCHQSQDPPRALISASRLTMEPIYTVLATCYEPSSIASYCYSWMVISTAREDFLYDYSDCLDHQIWSAKSVLELMEKLVLHGYLTIVNRAFKIFMPDNPFNAFFEFLLQCVEFANFHESAKSLTAFKTHCLTFHCNKSIHWDSTDSTYSENSYWVSTVAVKCIVIALAYCFDSALLQIKFLETLVNSNFHENLPAHSLDFARVFSVTKILLRTSTKFNFAAITSNEVEYNFKAEYQRCINDLINNGNYNNALTVSQVVGLDPADVILAQYRNEFKHLKDSNHALESDFWNRCASDFKKYRVHSEKAAEFFVKHAENVQSYKERYEILRLALETLRSSEIDENAIHALEVIMWKSCILAGPDNIVLEKESYNFTKLKTELLSDVNKLKGDCTLTEPAEKNAAEVLINRLLDIGRLDIALRISAMFAYKHKDLRILLLCLSLAEGETTPNQLTTQQKNLIGEISKTKQQKYSTLRTRRIRRLSSSSSLNVSSSSTNSPKDSDRKTLETRSITDSQLECMNLLETLLGSLAHGGNICSKVVFCYKLSICIRKNYQYLLTLKNPIEFLQEIIEGDYVNKYEIVSDVIAAYKIKSENVAEFLAHNITVNVTRAIEGGYDDVMSMWGYPLDAKFHLIMELCNDPSSLGSQIFNAVCKKLGRSNGENKSVTTLKIAVELLIRSHDCFTAACHMEGIALVLRKSQQLANVLQNLKLWALLVRLVTGIGRFTEMNYIFQILKENDQFEFLLGKGLHKVPGLKTALLEFLKRNCPENRELFTLVALHFRLYHEIALSWETEAKEIINELVIEAKKECIKSTTPSQEIQLTRNESVQKRLHLAVTSFTHATQYYLQEDTLNLASRCSDQAQLATLQSSLLAAVPRNHQAICILHLQSHEIDKILCKVLSFSQALVVGRAYNHQVDWANVIYYHCVLNGETKYFKDFIAVKRLTPTLVQDCARRYRSEKHITQTMTENMKLLITELSDVESKYVLASQLGFKDVVEKLLSNPTMGAYLKDTVWKKGTLQSQYNND